MKNFALIIFIATYIMLLIFPKKRPHIAILSASLFILLGILPLNKIFQAVDWNVLLMIAGTMGIATLFIESKMPAYLSDILIDRMPNMKWVIISLALFAGAISAFIDNVSTVLIVAPVALSFSRKLKINPTPIIISIAISSNLQGAATLVGDATSIMLGGYANMSFVDFIFLNGRPGIFWAVQLGAIASAFVLLYLFRKETQPIHLQEKEKVEDIFPTYLILSMILLLILVSFIPNKPQVTNGLICVSLFAIGVIREYLLKKDGNIFRRVLQEIDYFTLLLLLGLFMIIGGIVEVGIVKDISQLFVKVGGENLFLTFTLIVWASVFFSAFIDNIPYVATMLPVVQGISTLLGIEPYLLYFGLLSGATLGGNITPIGASANIAGIGLLRKEGYQVSVWEFMKYGLPFTLSAVIAGYIVIWVFWR
ncbi:MAG: putative transporter [candidate division WS2 bacterium]|nr:putative transporter [Candidatus Psychracetigena formicireducens]